MSNDERREKRVQASLRVRYKSATVTEFIEKHSHDISPGGVFIRSQKPLSKGSLLKIDFRLEDDSAVIQGVGRVVWTRDESTEGKPAGMGIKFIRLDENSRENIQKIISMQKAGMEITRASVFGEADDEADSDVTVPDGKSVRDSIAPSVENLPPSADESLEDNEDSIEPADDPDPDSADEITERSKRNKSVKSDDNASTGAMPEATVFPAEKEKSGNWGMIAVIALLVGGALIYAMMQRPGTEESANTSDDATDDNDTLTRETTDGAEPGDTTADADTPEDSAANAGTMSAGTDTDAAEGTDSGTDTETATDSSSDTETATGTSGDSDTAADPADESTAASGMSGEVVISINEPDATVALDGKVYREEMPIRLAGLPVGDHEILANLFGFRPLVTTVTAVAGEPLTVSLKLKKAKQVATFKANVVGVRVLVGDKQIGRTPMRTVKRLNDSFEYTLEKPGFEPFTGTVSRDDWTYDEGVYEVTVAATLTPKVKDDSSGVESGAPDAATPAADAP